MPTPSELLPALRRHFGFTAFLPGQEEAIRYLLTGSHALVVMPTGAGKSLVYQLAACLLPGTTLVISPLIALMKDQVDALTRQGITATAINSTLSSAEQSRHLRALAVGDFRLVYVAPERLRHVTFRQAVAAASIGLLAVDEAHCISQWGHDFRPDYLHIATARKEMGHPPTAALTATATPQVQGDIVRLLDLPQAKRIVTGFNRPNLTLRVRYTPDLPDKLRALREFLAENRGAGIIYVGTRRDAEEVADFVHEVVGRGGRAYHAGMEDAVRTAIQDAFMTGRLNLVVATNAFGMGIDRADVRFVLHFSLPGTLEAYYQEAGRAGRDGQPAQCVLLYSPQDRALQEWFIENDAPSARELEVIYRAVAGQARRGVAVLTLEGLTLATGLGEVKLRVGLSLLERMEALHRLGDEGRHLWLEVGEWRPERLRVTAAEVEARRAHKRRQLARMVAYAEADTCRRRLILAHFGDEGPAEAAACCDNCPAARTRRPPPSPADRAAFEALPQEARVALGILDTARRLPWPVGRGTLARILKGSRAKEIIAGGYDRSVYYGRLADLTLREIEELIEQLRARGYMKVVGGDRPVVRLTPRGREVLAQRAAISLRLPRQHRAEAVRRKREEREAGGSVAYTGELLAQGLSPAQIAAHRGLKESTIYGHLAQLIAAGVVDVDAVVPREIQVRVQVAIQQVGSTQALSPIKALLAAEISYDVVRCVVAAWERGQVRDEVLTYLSRPHPRPLPGPWEAGWALDFHSRFAGADWSRTETGEMAYRFKYGGETALAKTLAERLQALVEAHPELADVDAILAVPPSTPRPTDPVRTLAIALGRRLGVPVPADWLVKTRATQPQKEMHTLAQKRANVAGAFAVRGSVQGRRLLVLDDLYDSGATLEEVARALKRAGAAAVSVLTLTRTIHSDV